MMHSRMCAATTWFPAGLFCDETNSWTDAELYCFTVTINRCMFSCEETFPPLCSNHTGHISGLGWCKQFSELILSQQRTVVVNRVKTLGAANGSAAPESTYAALPQLSPFSPLLYLLQIGLPQCIWLSGQHCNKLLWSHRCITHMTTRTTMQTIKATVFWILGVCLYGKTKGNIFPSMPCPGLRHLFRITSACVKTWLRSYWKSDHRQNDPSGKPKKVSKGELSGYHPGKKGNLQHQNPSEPSHMT